jgi:type II secretory ATPase GspE/PulE/Tfp pilus assembly ATPase PilB-like protein
VLLSALPDHEAVDAAVRAAAAGRRVLTTLPPATPPRRSCRLIHLGVEPYMVAAATTLVVAQRLVRRLCNECAEPDVGATVQRLIDAGMTAGRAKDCRPKRAKGCKACLGGYRGRVALFEVLPVGAEMQARVLAGAGAAELRAEMARLGVPGLRQVGLTRVADGEIGLDDLLRATSE